MAYSKHQYVLRTPVHHPLPSFRRERSSLDGQPLDGITRVFPPVITTITWGTTFQETDPCLGSNLHQTKYGENAIRNGKAGIAVIKYPGLPRTHIRSSTSDLGIGGSIGLRGIHKSMGLVFQDGVITQCTGTRRHCKQSKLQRLVGILEVRDIPTVFLNAV